MKNVLILSTSPRVNSNSEALADAFGRGAQESGNAVEKITMRGKHIRFCLGCFVCQETGKCVIKDDMAPIVEKMLEADVLVFATPIYYYEMSGQMKTLLDRLNPLYPSDYRFRKVYMLSTATEDEEYVPEKAVSGLQGWVDCFEKAEFAGSLFCGGINDAGEADGKSDEKNEAYQFGKGLE